MPAHRGIAGDVIVVEGPSIAGLGSFGNMTNIHLGSFGNMGHVNLGSYGNMGSFHAPLSPSGLGAFSNPSGKRSKIVCLALLALGAGLLAKYVGKI